ncbi:unnamed protein product [Auanema sp. JU1783]|nr:unnamed protein product [Auanema sp. JU1783]
MRPVIHAGSDMDIPLPSMIFVYSTPALLLLLVIFIVKWRPCYEFSGFAHCFRWYILCCSKETKKEMISIDRQRILTIDAERLASEFESAPDSPKSCPDVEMQLISSNVIIEND